MKISPTLNNHVLILANMWKNAYLTKLLWISARISSWSSLGREANPLVPKVRSKCFAIHLQKGHLNNNKKHAHIKKTWQLLLKYPLLDARFLEISKTKQLWYFQALRNTSQTFCTGLEKQQKWRHSFLTMLQNKKNYCLIISPYETYDTCQFSMYN